MKYIYLFSEGNGKMRELLGGKGANLAEMTNLGMPVPRGFTITTEACTQYYKDGKKINDEITAQVMEYVKKLEEITGKVFGSVNSKEISESLKEMGFDIDKKKIVMKDIKTFSRVDAEIKIYPEIQAKITVIVEE